MAFRKLLMPLAVMLFLLVPQGCRISYKLNGAAIDYTVYKTINVGEFPIRAALVYAPLQQMFENELLDYITRNTRLTTVDSASDLELEGEITGYNLTPQAVTEDAYASKTRLTITVRVKYTDTKNDANDVSRHSRPIVISMPRRCSMMCRNSCVRKYPRNLWNLFSMPRSVTGSVPGMYGMLHLKPN